jgi:hypothetical protein
MAARQQSVLLSGAGLIAPASVADGEATWTTLSVATVDCNREVKKRRAEHMPAVTSADVAHAQVYQY